MSDMMKIANELFEASKIYYSGEEPIMTDEEYDSKLDYLSTLYKKSGENHKIIDDLLDGAVASGSMFDVSYDKTVKHDNEMLSLAKAKTPEELNKYNEKLVKNGSTGSQLQAKLDGFAISIKYDNLGNIEYLATRGDGTVGESMPWLINNSELLIKYLPFKINTNKEINVRGEVFMTDEQFQIASKRREELTGESFANSRNAVSGLMKKSEKGIGYKAEVTFALYSVYIENKLVDLDTFCSEFDEFLSVNELTRMECEGIDKTLNLKVSTNFEELMENVKKFGEARKLFHFPTDGVVIKPLNEVEMLEKMGFTGHHPIAYIAYKYPGLEVITTIEDITITVGKSGKLTPRVRVTPVDCDGTTITYASLHNYNLMHEMGVGIGAVVSVTRANDVIPQVVKVIIEGEKPLDPPRNCPSCEFELTFKGNEIPAKTIVCENVACDSRKLYSLKMAVGRGNFDIDGLSESGLNHMFDSGLVRNIPDLFKLSKEEISNSVNGVTSDGKEILVGDKRAEKIYNAIQRAKVNTEAYKVFPCLGIPGFGKRIGKELLKHYETFENIFNATFDELNNLEGFGAERANIFIIHKQRAERIYNELISVGVVPIMNKKDFNVEHKGTFAISGNVPDGYKNRGEFVSAMESLGWEFHSGPKKNTDYVIGDESSTSSKIVKAKKLGLKIVSELPK